MSTTIFTRSALSAKIACEKREIICRPTSLKVFQSVKEKNNKINQNFQDEKFVT